jgi:alcohol dehydrogenase (cytochrome c)
MDSRTNKIVWQKRTPGENNYGALSTAGGLVFSGQVDGNMTAIDAKTGDPLWKFQVGWGISAPPMTYSVDGVQYVTVAAGGNRGGLTTTDGDAVWTFALNGNIDEVAAPPPIQTKIELAGALVKIGDPVGRPQDIGGDAIFDGTISTGDYIFMPARASVPVGTTLTWRNDGNVIHTATENKQVWDTGDIPAGQSRSVTFDAPGTYAYTCNPHPWMFGQIIVQ